MQVDFFYVQGQTGLYSKLHDRQPELFRETLSNSNNNGKSLHEGLYWSSGQQYTERLLNPSTEIFIQPIRSFFLFTDNLHSECLNVVFTVP